jgi:hypothetical protein
VPDAEAAAQDSPAREEFGIEHLHVFSMASLCLMCDRAGFVVEVSERVREPSTKYTLRAFVTARLDPSTGREAVTARPPESI